MELLMNNKIQNYLEENYPDDIDDILLADGFDDAFLGVVEGFGLERKACYDTEKCIEILMDDGEMRRCEAEEYFNFNVIGAYVGERTPIFLNKL